MKGNGLKIKCMDLVLTISLMHQFTKEAGNLTSSVDMEFMNFQMVQYIKVIFRTT